MSTERGPFYRVEKAHGVPSGLHSLQGQGPCLGSDLSDSRGVVLDEFC